MSDLLKRADAVLTSRRDAARVMLAALKDGLDFWNDEDGDNLGEWRRKARAVVAQAEAAGIQPLRPEGAQKAEKAAIQRHTVQDTTPPPVNGLGQKPVV